MHFFFLIILFSAFTLWGHPNGTSALDIQVQQTNLELYFNANKRDLISSQRIELKEIKTKKDSLVQIQKYIEKHLHIEVNYQPITIHWNAIFEDTTDTYGIKANIPLNQALKYLSFQSSLYTELNFPTVSILNISRRDTTIIQEFIKSENVAFFEMFHANSYYLKHSKNKVSWIQYIVFGFIHILPFGLDHILFIIGLFLFSRRWKPLAWQSLIFTLAHSITLALAILNVFSLPSNIIEPLIALSIVAIIVENLFLKTSLKSRLLVVLAFGLLHGMGFASVLRDLSSNQEAFLSSLIFFNIGVEIGQIAILLLLFALTFFFYRHRFYHKVFVIPLNYLIGCIGLFWFIERIFFN